MAAGVCMPAFATLLPAMLTHVSPLAALLAHRLLLGVGARSTAGRTSSRAPQGAKSLPLQLPAAVLPWYCRSANRLPAAVLPRHYTLVLHPSSTTPVGSAAAVLPQC